MNPWINYHHLNYFRVIATEGSIAKASAKLRLGQPTLSAQLKQFEDTLGVQLFERRHKKLILTETGRMTLKYANEIFRLGAELLEVLHDRMDSAKAHVQIGALDSVPKGVVMSVVKAALNIAPCSVSILEGKGDELIRQLGLHHIDLFIANYSPSLGEGPNLFSRSLAKIPVAIYGAPSYKHLRKNFPRSLDRVPIILPTKDSKLRLDLEHYFATANQTLSVVAETQDTSLQKLLGVDGLGILPVTAMSIKDSLAKGELIELGKLPGVFEEIFLVSASRKIENPISSQLMKTLSL